MIYRLGDVELDTATMELRSSGDLVAVEPMVFDLLRLLIENHDRVVSRDELIECVWNGRFVSETTISSKINSARRALGDDGQRQSVIRTVARRGYRIVAEVQTVALYKGVEIPPDDASRVVALRAYGILDTPAEAEYDDITTMAARISGCKFAYISFCDETRFWLKSKFGYPEEFNERPRELSMCPATILQTDLLIVEDMRSHPRYRDLPSVRNPPYTRFYCAMPLIDPDGFALGTLCVWDSDEKSLHEDQKQTIRFLARQVMALLNMRRRIRDLEERREELSTLLSRMSSLIKPAS